VVASLPRAVLRDGTAAGGGIEKSSKSRNVTQDINVINVTNVTDMAGCHGTLRAGVIPSRR